VELLGIVLDKGLFVVNVGSIEAFELEIGTGNLLFKIIVRGEIFVAI